MIIEAVSTIAETEKSALLRQLLALSTPDALKSLLRDICQSLLPSGLFDNLMAFLVEYTGAKEDEIVENLRREFNVINGSEDKTCWINGPLWGDEESHLPKAEKYEVAGWASVFSFDACVKPLPMATSRSTINKIYSDKTIADLKCDR